MVTAGHKAEI